MITLRCPTCGLGAEVRARKANITCFHTGTVHDAKTSALMTVVATDQKVPA